ncbi:unnamed protein product [Phyllotreta striolata]|uniref:Cytochrome P450 monooxygenase n=1 Tax=Phyllotreta striolata TaxID=444603 RepID=A0A9P0GRE6_PHYSR|nr:unnamed protein product [Phyllotreta striolata]
MNGGGKYQIKAKIISCVLKNAINKEMQVIVFSFGVYEKFLHRCRIMDTFASQGIAALAIILVSYYFYVKYTYNYWKRKNVPQLHPTFPFGNYNLPLPKGFSIGPISKRYYDAFKKAGHAFGGVYVGMTPHVVLVDERLGRNVLTKDFQYFMDRGLYHRPQSIITSNMFVQNNEEWRPKRSKLTVIFTSAKMKFYFNTIKKCANELEANLDTAAIRNEDIDIYETMGCYFTDIISSLVYGIDAKSFKDPNAAIRKVGRELFSKYTLPFKMTLFLVNAYPNLAKMLGVPSIQKEIEDFFVKLVPDTMDYRKKNNIYREDLLQLLIDLNNSGTIASNDIIAETFNFFVAGYETSSTISTYLLYELAKHKDIQDKVRNEISRVLKNHNGEFSYDVIHELTYMNQVMKEASRKYPALATLTRVCVSDYQIPGTDVIIEKDTPVIIPILGYHFNPDYFPDPDKFDPDRFEGNVKYEGFLPFGDGPRNCIGERLGVMQVKLGVAVLLKNFEVSLSPTLKEPLVLDELQFVTKTTERIYLRIKKIDN